MRLLQSSPALPRCQGGSLPDISNESTSTLQRAAEFSAFHGFREAAGLALNILDTVQRTRFIHPYYTALTEAVCCTTQEVICYDLPLSKAMWDNASKLVQVLRAVNELVLAASAQSWCHKHFLTDKDIVTIKMVAHELYCITNSSTGVELKFPDSISGFGRLDMYGTICDLVSRIFHKDQSHDSSSSCTSQSLLSYFFDLILASLSTVYFILLLGLPSYYASRASYIGNTPEPCYFTSRQSAEIVDIDSDVPLPYTASPTTDNPTISLWLSMCQSLVEEWKAFRVLSALTLGAGLALFQIPSVSNDLLICFSAYFTLICMLMSTIFATIEIIYFKSWRDMRVIASWFHAIQQAGHSSAWNAWILFSLPALWTAWGAFFFLICIFLLIWRSDPAASSVDSASLVSSEELMGFRISLTVLMVLALMYLILMLVTFRRIQHECSAAAGRIKDTFTYV